MRGSLLPDLRPVRLALRRPGPGDAIPGVAHRLLDLLPGRGLLPTVLVALPPGAQVGLRVIPAPSERLSPRLEPVAVRGPEPVVVVGAQGIGPTAEVLVPIVVFGLPGRGPGRVVSHTVSLMWSPGQGNDWRASRG